jgi:hypothetical protein
VIRLEPRALTLRGQCLELSALGAALHLIRLDPRGLLRGLIFLPLAFVTAIGCRALFRVSELLGTDGTMMAETARLLAANCLSDVAESNIDPTDTEAFNEALDDMRLVGWLNLALNTPPRLRPQLFNQFDYQYEAQAGQLEGELLAAWAALPEHETCSCEMAHA